jgi:FtsP/CotA-like multicopper oxidase with cupredoxin domain
MTARKARGRASCAAPRKEGDSTGRPWMAHYHIAEHHESGIMFSFNVTP